MTEPRACQYAAYDPAWAMSNLAASFANQTNGIIRKLQFDGSEMMGSPCRTRPPQKQAGRTRAAFGVLLVAFAAQACSGAEKQTSPVDAEAPSSASETRASEPATVIQSNPVPAPAAPAGDPPRVDTSIASVPLRDVLFDTFRGGFIRLSEAAEREIDALRDRIAPIYEPKYDDVSGGDWLREEDMVIGLASRSGPTAYPIKMLNLHELVNDVIDGEPVLISYCPLCASGVVYSRRLDGRVLLFGNTSALFESDLVMFDHETGSYWCQVVGEAIVGSLTAARLTMLPSVTVPWGQWKRLHPDTRVLSRSGGLLSSLAGNPYDRDPFANYDESVNRGRFAFPVSEEKLDSRLKHGDLVLAIQVGDRHKAYPLTSRPPEAINDDVGGRPVVILVRPAGPSGSAYARDIAGQTLTFSMKDGAIVDAETNSVWDDAGRAISGPLAGTELEMVPSRTSFWFALAVSIPGVELYE